MLTKAQIAARLWAITKRDHGWDAYDILQAHPETIAAIERPDADAVLTRGVPLDLDAVIESCLQIHEQNSYEARVAAYQAEINTEHGAADDDEVNSS